MNTTIWHQFLPSTVKIQKWYFLEESNQMLPTIPNWGGGRGKDTTPAFEQFSLRRTVPGLLDRLNKN